MTPTASETDAATVFWWGGVFGVAAATHHFLLVAGLSALSSLESFAPLGLDSLCLLRVRLL